MTTKYNQYIYKNGNWLLTGTSSDIVTYSLTQNNNKLILTGSNGDTDEVTLPDSSKIDIIKVNGTTLTITDKTVDISVPTLTSELTNDSNFVSDANYVHTDNNFTTALKNKLEAVQTGATKVESSSTNGNIKINGTETTVYTLPTITASDVGAIPTSQKGTNGGIAELDSAGKVPASQLPSYVDDVLEYENKSSFPSTGETGKIYVDKSTNLTWRWSGSDYVEISPSLALGTTSSTAFRGDYGNAAYTHAVTNKGSAFSSGLYKITTNSEGHVTAATAAQKSDITSLGIPAQDTTYNNATTSTSGLMSNTDKTKLDAYPAYESLLSNSVHFKHINIGNGTDTQYVIKLSDYLGTDILYNYLVTIENITIIDKSTGDEVFADITVTNDTSSDAQVLGVEKVTIKFASTPSNNQYECRIVYGFSQSGS